MTRTLTPQDAASLVRTRDAVGFGLGPAIPDAFMTALGGRDDWEDLVLGGALLLGLYEVLGRPGVSYRCGFYGPVERYYLSQGARIDHVPGGFRQFGPILARFSPRVMVVQTTPPGPARASSTCPCTTGPPGTSSCGPAGTPSGCWWWR